MRYSWALLSTAILAIGLAAGCELSGGDERDERAREAPRETAAVPGGGLRLSAEAQRAVGLKVAKVTRRQVAGTIAATGWLALEPGNEVVVKAPAAGFVALAGSETVTVGSSVAQGSPLASLEAILSPKDQADLVSAKEDADTVMRQSQVTIQMAEAQRKRLEGAQNAVAGTRLAELQETIDKARVAYEEAQQKLPFLPQEPYGDLARGKPITVACPLAGQVTAVHVRPGQFVVEGDPLWTVADWTRLWVRVPVFEGDLPRVAADQPAVIVIPGTAQSFVAQSVKSLQPTDPGRRSVDLYYEINSAGGGNTRTGALPSALDRRDGEARPGPVAVASPLRPGQAVAVSLPTGGKAERVVVPRSAVVWDGLGASWVYVQTGTEEFHRRRVELGPATGDDVALQRGLDEGQQVVVAGAETLYGEEFKSQIPEEEEE